MKKKYIHHFSLSLFYLKDQVIVYENHLFLLFSENIYVVSILFYKFTEFILLLYTFLVSYFAQYKEHMIWQISFSKFSNVLTAFTCASAIGNLWSTCLGVNILRCELSETLALWGDIPRRSFPCV